MFHHCIVSRKMDSIYQMKIHSCLIHNKDHGPELHNVANKQTYGHRKHRTSL